MRYGLPVAMKCHALLSWVAWTLATAAVSAGEVSVPARPVFSRDVQPILSDNCYECHGPDEKARKARLRLDLRAEAFKPIDQDLYAIRPGHPEQSELIARIETEDPDDVMPPPKTGKRLTADQKAILRRWITQGAPWPEHWAFIKPQRPEPPRLQEETGVRNPIDRFIRARLEQEGLKPAPEADPTTLIRRVSLDLTGLPPTVEEVEAFLADGTPEAYEKLVDRLLASPRYGEHQAHYWLDAVRYADTHGYHIDARRDIWAYRDYVIRSFNQNKPFDQFTIEQLAGDLLPEPTVEQKVATGYIRCNLSTGEGGAIEEEYRAKYAFDRTETTAANWLGLTLVCARCHSHKYDPIPHKEYYRMLAFFDNLDEPIMDGNKPNPPPFLKLPSPEQTRRLAWLKQHLTEGETKARAADPVLDEPYTQWLNEWGTKLAAGWKPVALGTGGSAAGAGGPQAWIEPDHSIRFAAQSSTGAAVELWLRPQASPLAGLKLELRPESGSKAEAIPWSLAELEAEWVWPVSDKGDQSKQPRTQRIPFTRAISAFGEKNGEIGRAIDGKQETAWRGSLPVGEGPVTGAVWFEKPAQPPEGAVLRLRLRLGGGKDRAWTGRLRVEAAQGPELVEALRPVRLEPWFLLGPLPSAGLEVGLAQAYPPEEAVDLKAEYDGVRDRVRWHSKPEFRDGTRHLLVNELHGVHGVYYLYRRILAPRAMPLEVSLRADDAMRVWLNGQEMLTRSAEEGVAGVASRFRLSLRKGENTLLVKVVNHQGAKYFAFSAEPGGTDLPSPQIAAILSLSGQPAGAWSDQLRDWYRRQFSEAYRQLFNDLATWREEQAAIEAAIPTTLIAKERTERRQTHLLHRGEYDKPGEVVEPGVLSVLHPFPKGVPTNRLGLACWIVSPDNPLTARVIVNRFWQQFFGVGLVKTAEDFGARGERPSHPELLDWLATEFIRSGWEVKHIHRLIVTSATYRQSSRATPELIERDPENRLLARGPRFRADAEVIRDLALYAGGLLVEKIGGPSVKPYEPPGLWETVSFNNSQKYVPDKGEGQYRRSLYTFWKRQSPPPNMLLFDAPSREYCVARRPRTNTPLQALVTLNDPQFVEAARAMAVRVLREGGPTAFGRLSYAFRLATARQPRDAELAVLLRTLRAQLKEFRTEEGRRRAAEFLQVGSWRAPAELDAAELAAWTTITSMILNLDETLTKG